MGKSRNKKELLAASALQKKPRTLREEITGKNQFAGSSSNVKTTLKMNHLQNLASWAGGEASIPSLAAFLGNRLASCGEAAGMPLDQSLFSCNRCETILQPGYNCTVRIEKKRGKVRRHNKSGNPTKNDVIYTCHFCSNRNKRKGTQKAHMKEILASKPKPISKTKLFPIDQKSGSSSIAIEQCWNVDKKLEGIPLKIAPPLGLDSDISKLHAALVKKTAENSPTTPVEKVQTFLSMGNKRKKSGSGLSKQVGAKNESVATDLEKGTSNSSKKRRKSWSSLKKIAEENELKNKSKIINLTIPFHI